MVILNQKCHDLQNVQLIFVSVQRIAQASEFSSRLKIMVDGVEFNSTVHDNISE